MVQYRTINTTRVWLIRRQVQLRGQCESKRDAECEEVSAADVEQRKREKAKLVLDDVTHTHTRQTSPNCFKNS